MREKKRPRSHHLLRHWEHLLIGRQKRYRLSPRKSLLSKLAFWENL